MWPPKTTQSHDEDTSQNASASGPPTSNSQPSPWGSPRRSRMTCASQLVSTHKLHKCVQNNNWRFGRDKESFFLKRNDFAGTDTNAVSCGQRGADEPVDEAQRHCGCAVSLMSWTVWHLKSLTYSTLTRTSMREAAHATRETVARAPRVVR